MRRLTRRSEDVAREAGETPLTTSDLVTDGLTEQEALGLRAEAHLRAGRLPSLSPEEEEADGGTTRRKGGCAANEASYVWNSLEARLAPEGVAAAPYWQREALHRTHWQVDVKQRESKRAAKARLFRTHTLTPVALVNGDTRLRSPPPFPTSIPRLRSPPSLPTSSL